jgi:hypothetical protein
MHVRVGARDSSSVHLAKEWDMPEPDQLTWGLPLAEAIQALREELLEAWRLSSNEKLDRGDAEVDHHYQLRFRPAPVELTLHVGATRTGTGKAGIKWWLIEAGGEKSRQEAVTQTIKLMLEPVLIGPGGKESEFFISDVNEPFGVEGDTDEVALVALDDEA